MFIKIAERLRPYSHLPGTFFVLPGTAIRLQLFPTLIKIEGLFGADPVALGALALTLHGPIEDFTAQQDLEIGCIRVWGKTTGGFFRYCIKALQNNENQGFTLFVEKAPQDIIGCRYEGTWHFTGGNSLPSGSHAICTPQQCAPPAEPFAISVIERLSLGNHKSQDFELIRRRQDFCEIFPLWHRLGLLVPAALQSPLGTCQLLKECQQAIDNNQPEKILPYFRRLYVASFDFALSPRRYDTDFHGIADGCVSIMQGSPMGILSVGVQLIRSLFIQETQTEIQLLPALPPEFHCGRYLHIACNGGELEIEWTKKAIRRATFLAHETRTIAFVFKDKNKCRIRISNQDRGRSYSSGEPLEISAGTTYWLDNFTR